MAHKKENLASLRDLIGRLSDSEQRNLRQYLCCFDPNFDQDHKVKTLELLDLLLHNSPALSESAIIKVLYPDGNANAFKFLRLRLQDKIHESLLLDVNVAPSQKYSDGARSKIDLRKSLLLAEILWGRGHTDSLHRLLDRVVRKARQMEHFGIAAEALRLKQRFVGMREGVKAFWQIDQEILFAEGMERAIQQAQKLHSFAQIRRRETPDVKIWVEIAPQLADLALGWPCDHTRYYDLQGRKEAAIEQRAYAEAYAACHLLAQLLANPSPVSSDRRQGLTLAAQAELGLLTQQYSEAIQLAIQARKLFQAESLNQASTFEIEFYARLYSGNAHAALSIISKAIQGNPGPQTEHQFQRWQALLAFGQFAVGNFDEAWRTIQKSPFLLQHKFQWNIPIRLLEIMLLIELRQFDTVDLPLESLRKQLRKAKVSPVKLQRYDTILTLLKALQKTGFAFAKLPRSYQSQVQLLLPESSPAGWEVLHGEVVPFQDWFLKKWGKESKK